MRPYPFDESQGSYYETMQELTPEEEFYNSKVEVSEEVERYINHLEQKLRAKNKSTQVLIEIMEQTPNSFCVNELYKLLKL